jgi:hypothetical protein
MPNSRWLVLSLIIATGTVAGAQTQISIQSAPTPEQTLHVTATQELAISTTLGATAGEPGGAQVITKAVFGYTQSNGRFNDEGRMDSQLTIDRIEMVQTLNGRLKPPSDMAQYVGHSLTAVFDRSGKLVDIRVPKELQQGTSLLKQLVAAAYGALNFLPNVSMTIGETVDAPSDVPLALPGSSAKASFQTRTVMKLRAVEQSGQDRIARLEQRIESVDETAPIKVNGSGTIDLNLDRGFVTASETEWIFTGAFAARGTAATPPASQIRGTLKVTVTANETKM